MRPLFFVLLFGWIALSPAAATTDPPERRIVQMALLRMVEQVDYLSNASFGPSVVHPQPEGRYWAVVGEVASGALTGNMLVQVYVAAIRLVCDEAEDAACWHLEKLALGNEIVYDRGDPL